MNRNLVKLILNYERGYSIKKFSTKLIRQPSYLHYIGRDPLVYRTIGQQLDLTAKKFGDREALVSCHEDERLTFSNVQQKANQLANGFHKLGLKNGDRIGIWSPNNLQWYLTMIGAAKAGLISVALNPAYQSREIEYCLKKVGVKAIVMPESYKTQNYYDMLMKIMPEIGNSQPGNINSKNVPSLKSIIVNTDKNLPGIFHFNDIFNANDTNSIENYENSIEPDLPCNIQFTSGTTGHPKAAVLSHFTFVNNSLQIGYRNELDQKAHRICMQNPLFHAYGVVITIMAAMCHGATIVLPDAGFNPELSLKTIVDEKCTIVHGTPTMYVDLITTQKRKQMQLKTLELAITGGATCSPQLYVDMKNILGVKKVKTIYGLTETTAAVFQSMLNESKELVENTVGHIHDHIEVKVINGNGETIPFGQPGELCVRGYSTMLGYYGDLEKTQEIMGNDKWLKTGDQFILEENGYGKVVGRLKDMIIRGGENIFPKEIEDYINTHPDIIESHVIGVPDERMGEEICAFIRMCEGVKDLTQQELKNFCKGNISHFKIPRYMKIVEDFPKTISGKIQKFKLLENFQKEYNLI